LNCNVVCAERELEVDEVVKAVRGDYWKRLLDKQAVNEHSDVGRVESDGHGGVNVSYLSYRSRSREVHSATPDYLVSYSHVALD